MIGRKLKIIDVKNDFWIHRYRHSKHACKTRRRFKKYARHLDRKYNKNILENEKEVII